MRSQAEIWNELIIKISTAKCIRMPALTQLDEALGKLENTLEPAVLRVRGPLERDEEDKETRLRGVEHEVSLLAAVRANHSRSVVDAVVHFHIIERTAAIERSGRD